MQRFIPFDALKLATAPVLEPISLAEAKDHLRIRTEDVTQDTYITNTLIPTARKVAEDWQHRAYITQTWDLYLDAFPSCGEIRLPRPPLQTVTSIVYTLADATTATVAAASYVVDAVSEPGRILLKDGYWWPGDVLQIGPSVKIRYVAGYGLTGASVPIEMLRAMYLLIGHFHENRELLITGTISQPIGLALDTLLSLDRNFA